MDGCRITFVVKLASQGIRYDVCEAGDVRDVGSKFANESELMALPI